MNSNYIQREEWHELIKDSIILSIVILHCKMALDVKLCINFVPDVLNKILYLSTKYYWWTKLNLDLVRIYTFVQMLKH